MSAPSLHDTHAVVTGASRGFGRAIAAALLDAGATVVGIARDADRLTAAHRDLGPNFVPVVGDAADPRLAAEVLRDHRPRTVVLNAGAEPTMRPLQDHSWETFSRCWDVDVRQVFYWLGQCLRQPLPAGSTVVAMSSGAALNGSPLSGGYAGAKATIRHLTSYAAEESARTGLGIRFACVLPKLTPATDLGSAAVAAYAERAGLDVDAFLTAFGPTSTAEDIAAGVVGLVADIGSNATAYALPPGGGLVAL